MRTFQAVTAACVLTATSLMRTPKNALVSGQIAAACACVCAVRSFSVSGRIAAACVCVSAVRSYSLLTQPQPIIASCTCPQVLGSIKAKKRTLHFSHRSSYIHCNVCQTFRLRHIICLHKLCVLHSADIQSLVLRWHCSVTPATLGGLRSCLLSGSGITPGCDLFQVWTSAAQLAVSTAVRTCWAPTAAPARPDSSRTTTGTSAQVRWSFRFFFFYFVRLFLFFRPRRVKW